VGTGVVTLSVLAVGVVISGPAVGDAVGGRVEAVGLGVSAIGVAVVVAG
jgi:hypothetical protein